MFMLGGLVLLAIAVSLALPKSKSARSSGTPGDRTAVAWFFNAAGDTVVRSAGYQIRGDGDALVLAARKICQSFGPGESAAAVGIIRNVAGLGGTASTGPVSSAPRPTPATVTLPQSVLASISVPLAKVISADSEVQRSILAFGIDTLKIVKPEECQP